MTTLSKGPIENMDVRSVAEGIFERFNMKIDSMCICLLNEYPASWSEISALVEGHEIQTIIECLWHSRNTIHPVTELGSSAGIRFKVEQPDI